MNHTIDIPESPVSNDPIEPKYFSQSIKKAAYISYAVVVTLSALSFDIANIHEYYKAEKEPTVEVWKGSGFYDVVTTPGRGLAYVNKWLEEKLIKPLESLD